MSKNWIKNPYSKEIAELLIIKPLCDAGELSREEAKEFAIKWKHAIESGAI